MTRATRPGKIAVSSASTDAVCNQNRICPSGGHITLKLSPRASDPKGLQFFCELR
jgi:hypothetical protein